MAFKFYKGMLVTKNYISNQIKSGNADATEVALLYSFIERDDLVSTDPGVINMGINDTSEVFEVKETNQETLSSIDEGIEDLIAQERDAFFDTNIDPLFISIGDVKSDGSVTPVEHAFGMAKDTVVQKMHLTLTDPFFDHTNWFKFGSLAQLPNGVRFYIERGGVKKEVFRRVTDHNSMAVMHNDGDFVFSNNTMTVMAKLDTGFWLAASDRVIVEVWDDLTNIGSLYVSFEGYQINP